MKQSIIIFQLMFLAICCWAQPQPPVKTTKNNVSLFNSSWRNEQTGDWQLSLFGDCAIYDSKVWKYETKSEKKVVLADGERKVTIAIGKDKAGKRDFTIDGTRMLLSQIAAQYLPDYPTADSTAFSTEIKPGEATIIGYLKDIPEEHSFGKIYLKVQVADYIKAWKEEFSVAVDKNGKFTLKVPLFGVNIAYLRAENGSNTIVWSPMILESGNTYFFMHDFCLNQNLFMGKDARLQNEIQGKWNVMEYGYEIPKPMNTRKMIEYYNNNINWYNNTLEKLKKTISEHPTISKRYRDCMMVTNRYATCNLMVNTLMASTTGRIPDITNEWISKNGYLDPQMPLTLTEKLGSYHTVRGFLESGKICRRYYLSPTQLVERVDNGNIKLDNADIDLLRQYASREKEQEKIAEMEDDAERSTMREIIDSKYPMTDIWKLVKRPHIDSLFKNNAPTRFQMEKMVIDSLYKDCRLYDFALSLWLMRNMRISEEGLPKELFQYVDEVSDTILKNKLFERHHSLSEKANNDYAEAEACLRPSSDVEGLTDGKVILEKILAPLKGKFVHIDFWGTWCGGCIKQLQALPMLKSELKDYDMVYLYFANNSKDNALKQMIQQFQLYGENCVHYNLPKEQERALEKYLKVIAFPTYILVDKQGNLHNMGNAVMTDIPAYKEMIYELNK